jgi:hypothetical protein
MKNEQTFINKVIKVPLHNNISEMTSKQNAKLFNLKRKTKKEMKRKSIRL